VRKIEKELKNKMNVVVYLLLLISIILILIGKDQYIGNVTDWTVSIITGMIATALSQSLVQSLSGKSLKRIFLNIKVFNKKYSVSIFIIVSMAVKIWLFN